MEASNSNSRLEAFSDGVFAVALTLLVIDIKVPNGEAIKTTEDLWLAIGHLTPSIFAFLLSFIIILIAWVNHHGTLKLVHKSSPTFIFANGFLLLTIVILPFATALLSENLLTDHATPAVVVYAAVNALQSLAWIFLGHAGLGSDPLTKNDKAFLVARAGRRSSYLSLAMNILLVVLAFWYPLIVAFLLGAIWLGWLVYGISMSSE